jgi:hypothetical protein
MIRLNRLTVLGAGIATATLLSALHPARAQIGLEREVLLQEDLTIPGYQIVMAEVTIAVGGRATYPSGHAGRTHDRR